MWIAEQVPEASVIAAGLMLALNRGKFGSQDQYGPDQGDRSQHQVGLDDAQRLRSQIRVIEVLGFHRIHLLRTQFHARKDECCADENAADGTEGVEGLREVEASLRTLRIAQLCDKRIGRSLQKRQSAGDHEKGEQE